MLLGSSAPLMIVSFLRISSNPTVIKTKFTNFTRLLNPKLVVATINPCYYSLYRFRCRVSPIQSYYPIFMPDAKVNTNYGNLDQSVLILQYKDVICRTDLSFYINNTIYILDDHCRPSFINYNNKNHSVLDIKYNIYDKVILIGHEISNHYDHWFTETFPLFFALPESIIEDSFIAVRDFNQFIFDSLKILGFNRSQIIYGEDLYFYSHNLFTVYGNPCYFPDYSTLLAYRDRLCNIFSLDKFPPSRHVIMNSKIGSKQHISNFEELFNEISNRFRNFSFEVGIVHHRFLDSIKYFNTIKLLVSVHNSYLSNVIFMQPETYFVEIHIYTENFLILRVAVFTGKKVIIVKSNNNNKNSKIIDTNVNIESVIEGLNYAVFSIEREDTFFQFE